MPPLGLCAALAQAGHIACPGLALGMERLPEHPVGERVQVLPAHPQLARHLAQVLTRCPIVLELLLGRVPYLDTILTRQCIAHDRQRPRGTRWQVDLVIPSE